MKGGGVSGNTVVAVRGDTLSPVVMEKPAGTGGGATRPDPSPTKRWRTVFVSTILGMDTALASTCVCMDRSALFQFAVSAWPNARRIDELLSPCPRAPRSDLRAMTNAAAHSRERCSNSRVP